MIFAASPAGTKFDYRLLRALLFAMFVSMILQEMATALVIGVITVRNAAPQGGNEGLPQVEARHTQHFRQRPPQSQHLRFIKIFSA